ncbi:hypothetical protein TrLO_g1957 [Triparma laevis f. longispina]|uniref:Uncharacterized protein n=1 Tax=Triparma laevis f. longispina TaxID=1714387 RepID=A0A9W7AH69_9STRA|nr:hypothetical protein TrLO_g1957 [Triparma laevis f. longispina]
MFMQICVAFIQNRKKILYFATDTIAILTGLKPALDAFKFGSGAEKEEHQIGEPLMEMTFCKACEMVFEAIQASIVQTYALLLAKEK